MGIPLDVRACVMPYLAGVRAGRDTEKPAGEGARIITSHLIKKWFKFPEFDPTVYNKQILRSAFAFANNCIRRSSEVLQKTFEGLKVGNLHFDNGTTTPSNHVKCVMVVFHFSKGNQLGKAQCCPCFHWCERGYTCFLCEIIRIYNWRKKDWKDSMPLFQFENGKSMHYRLLNKTIKICCIQMDIIPDGYTLHGLRGGASWDQKMLGVGEISRELVAGWKGPGTRIKYDKKVEPIHLMQQVAFEAGFELPDETAFNYINILDTQRKEKIQIKDKEKTNQLTISNQRLHRLGLLPNIS